MQKECEASTHCFDGRLHQHTLTVANPSMSNIAIEDKNISHLDFQLSVPSEQMAVIMAYAILVTL
jgi:hypothetical protein